MAPEEDKRQGRALSPDMLCRDSEEPAPHKRGARHAGRKKTKVKSEGTYHDKYK